MELTDYHRDKNGRQKLRWKNVARMLSRWLSSFFGKWCVMICHTLRKVHSDLCVLQRAYKRWKRIGMYMCCRILLFSKDINLLIFIKSWMLYRTLFQTFVSFRSFCIFRMRLSRCRNLAKIAVRVWDWTKQEMAIIPYETLGTPS